MIDLYTDGGVIIKNPSKIGGTYAWALVEPNRDRLLSFGSGIFTPKWMDKKEVTNNHTELVAALYGVREAKDRGIQITRWYSDSEVTLGRISKGWALKNVPEWMVCLLQDLRPGFGIQCIHVDGHQGNQWNEFCDLLCQRAGEEYLMYK